MNRRNFIQTTLATSAIPLVSQAGIRNDKPKTNKVRLGFIGVGLRGRTHLDVSIKSEDVEIVAICDIDPDAIAQSQAMIKKAGKKEAAVYGKNETDYKNLLKRDDIDGVVISTPWELHVPMSVDTIYAGKHAAVEVSATVTLQESWDLVNAYEATGKHCMILENVCYRRDVMAVLNMVRKGMFGEVLYGHCGYQHDLRHVKFNDGKSAYGKGVEFGEKGISEARWRTQHSVDRNGDLYPTHGLGPVAHWMNINRGNKFNFLTSMATSGKGLHKYIVDNGGKDHPNAKVKFKLGDVVTTTIQCENGENIVLMHDTNLPRPYSLGFRAQGTQGIWMDDNKSIHLEGITPDHRWEPFEKYQKEYDHPLWKKFENDAKNAGHGGIDFFVMRAFIESIKRDVAPPMDVYDAAAWSAISPLSELSIARGSSPVEIPDFTRGKWKTNKPIFGLNDLF